MVVSQKSQAFQPDPRTPTIGLLQASLTQTCWGGDRLSSCHLRGEMKMSILHSPRVAPVATTLCPFGAIRPDCSQGRSEAQPLITCRSPYSNTTSGRPVRADLGNGKNRPTVNFPGPAIKIAANSPIR